MEPTLQTFAQQILNCHAATTVEQKLAFLKSAREYVTVYAPPIDALCLSTVFNLQVFGHFVLFQELLMLIETILTAQPRVELILPVCDFVERVGHGCSDEWMSIVLQMCGRVFAVCLPHILNGRFTTLAASWRLCWQKVSCLGQSLAFKALSSPHAEFQLAGISFMETLILLYTEPATLTTAGRSGRGAPTADMFLFNCRYLVDQLTDQLSAEGLSGRTPLAVIETLTRVVTYREKYFDSMVPHLLKLAETGRYKVAPVMTTASEGAFEMRLAAALKLAFLALMECRISNRQKSMLILGLSQLSAREDPLNFDSDLSPDAISRGDVWDCLRNYIAESGTETPQVKRMRLETHLAQPPSDEEPAGMNQGMASDLIEKAKTVFQGKLSVEDVKGVMDILARNDHTDCLLLIADQLPPGFIADLVISTFTDAPLLEPPERESLASKADVGTFKGQLLEMKPLDKGSHQDLPETQPPEMEMRSLTMSLGERQMLIENSSSQLLKNESSDAVSDLPLGIQSLSKLASRSTTSSIPLHIMTDFITQKVSSKPEVVREVSVQFLFDLFVAHGSSQHEISDIPSFLHTMDTFHTHQLEHPYDQALHKIIHRISVSEVEGRDKLLRNLLLDVPALPPAVVFDFFQSVLTDNATTAMPYLITANALMESQPVLKPVLLETVLAVCVSPDSEIREKGIRLVKNKLHQDTELSERIEQFAIESLQLLVHLEPPSAEDLEGSPARHCHLYLALCTRKAPLLRKLLETFVEATAAGKAVLMENAKQLSEAVLFLLPELLNLIQSVPEGAEPLLLLLLSLFPDKSPPQRVIDACMERFHDENDVRYLVPVLPGLPKKRVMELVPLLTQLPLTDFATAVTDLVGHLPFGDAVIEPSEILVSLSTFSEIQGDTEKLSRVRAALDYCIKQMTTVFDREVLAGALNKLVHMTSLPVLFMRMVLLSISREKELGTFVLHSVLSASVISSKIRSDVAQWQGYVLLLQKMIPASFRHLLTLPTRLMTAALSDMPKSFSERFLEFVESPECDVRASKDALTSLREFVADFEEASKSKKTLVSQPQQSEAEMSTSLNKTPIEDTPEAQSLKDTVDSAAIPVSEPQPQPDEGT